MHGWLLRLTGNETSLRVEIPPSRSSPCLRARTKTTSSCCRLLAGEEPQPTHRQDTNAVGARRQLGRGELLVRRRRCVDERPLDRSPSTRRVLEAEPDRPGVPRHRVGVIRCLPTTRRAGGDRRSTSIGPVPAGQRGEAPDEAREGRHRRDGAVIVPRDYVADMKLGRVAPKRRCCGTRPKAPDGLREAGRRSVGD